MQVYLDHNATTPLHDLVKGTIIDSLSLYGNPSSVYAEGIHVKSLINNARTHCAALINAGEEEIIFTGGGSESNNSILNYNFINNLVKKNKTRNEIIVSAVEHPAIRNCAKSLGNNGFKVHYAPVDFKGRIILDQFKPLLSERTALVSIMLANNEIGTIQDIKKLAELAHSSGALFHTDAVQAAGKIPVDVKELNVDYLSYSGHKIYGPKGIGVLYIKEGSPFVPLIYGGSQEGGKRSGTENVLGIIGLGKAAELNKIYFDEWYKKNSCLKNKFIKELTASIKNICFNGDMENSLPQTLNVSFLGTEAELVQLYLDTAGIKVSTGSACSSGTPSKVLKAIGLDEKTAGSAIRFSLGAGNTEEEIEYTVRKLRKIVSKLIG
jgi:cysteine desulfurase